MNDAEKKVYDEALRRIADCQREGKTELDLSQLNLTHLPTEIGNLVNLTELYLHSNQLSRLPTEIGNLSNLTALHLDSNQLSGLPTEIGNLGNLTTLYLDSNQLSGLPIEIGNLVNLTTLFLHSNRLSGLPTEIGSLVKLTRLFLHSNQLSGLPTEIGSLVKLTTLYLHSNQLSGLPSEIGNLGNLTTLSLGFNQLSGLPREIGNLVNLTTLSLDSNQLSGLPMEIGNLVNLTTLDLDFNQLSGLPTEIGNLVNLTTLDLHSNQLSGLPPEIGNFSDLTRLSLSSNQLSELPKEIGNLINLTSLSLGSNQLSGLPREIGNLGNLTTLFLHDNPLLAISDSILGPTIDQVYGTEQKTPAKPADILNFYFRRHESDSQPINEIKVMLVGRGGAGKTSLRRFFMDQPHDMEEKETPGINLDSFVMRCPHGELTVRLWDFAGQEITHALHQFFLTDGSVYILVLDPRSDTEMQDAEYWLGLLKRYAGKSPIVVALNRQDARQGGYDVDRRRLQQRFPSIHSFTATNCEQREGCETLKQKLAEAITSLGETSPPHLKVPDMWLSVMESCDQKSKQEKRHHLTLDEFREICALHGETTTDKQESLARLLHKLGVVLHFVDEPRLRDTAVLTPHWVTDGVYRLLRFKDKPASDGTLTLAEALEALPGETETEARFFLRLMERFEMCFPLDQTEETLPGKWLIPGSLEKFQPEGVTDEWQNPGSVKLRYIYDPLPEGVIPRFIVVTHLLSEDLPRWRNGVILAEGSAKALLRRGDKNNHIEITAFGPEQDRLRLLEIIQGHLERIHRDLPDPKPVAEQELQGFETQFRSIVDLEAAERNQQNIAIHTAEGDQLVEPTPQLNQASEEASRKEDRIPLQAFLSYSHADKRAKGIFQNNLAVMTQKNLILPWEDGMIEAGTLWREQIEDNLERMDIFIGLLTTAFLASEFIQKVELKAARDRLKNQNRNFLFILILMDDISLEGLDLSEYQLVKPNHKSVSNHKNTKAGFDTAQKELEKLILKQQIEKKEHQQGRPFERGAFRIHHDLIRSPQIVIHGDYIEGHKQVQDSHDIKIGGSVTNSQVGGTLNDCKNIIQGQAPGEVKRLLEELQQQVRDLVSQLPEEKQQKVAKNLKAAVKESTAVEPDREWYDVSTKGLLEAAKGVKDFTGNIARTVLTLGKLLFQDFTLPG